jgi:hypothetical protein
MVAGAIGILGGLFIFDSFDTLQTLMYSCGLGVGAIIVTAIVIRLFFAVVSKLRK